ncbi:DUF3618 domain-containing protein [Actinomadura sp. DC4]|uniref:DUF3618 domain-containing protein n=1 Tax=Actinomadura sp. DC4 TaxID=3055069 RepID=UPI0025B1DCF3|nr:DUF3618 domain-containing protein [Actinomadura sp. DC4]MDN3357244.1 DUF3618 domain-containing protein [Actinomadura sp. DC4]
MSHDTQPRGTPDERGRLTADIAQTRQDLAATVQALAAKADVPARVRDRAGDLQERLTGLGAKAREKAPQGPAVRPAVLYAVAGACAVAGLLLWKRGRS